MSIVGYLTEAGFLESLWSLVHHFVKGLQRFKHAGYVTLTCAE